MLAKAARAAPLCCAALLLFCAAVMSAEAGE
jgi:hypothetical protein